MMILWTSVSSTCVHVHVDVECGQVVVLCGRNKKLTSRLKKVITKTEVVRTVSPQGKDGDLMTFSKRETESLKRES